MANTIQWPHGPGGWGFSHEDAHTILLPPPRWDPENSTVRKSDRERAREGYRSAQAGTPTSEVLYGEGNDGPSQHPGSPMRTQAPSHAGTTSLS